MRKIFFTFISFVVICSCNKDPQPLTKEEMKHKIDSLTMVRIQQSDAQAKKDLEDRMKIEVKVKVDSIVSAKLQSLRVDTGKKAKARISVGRKS